MTLNYNVTSQCATSKPGVDIRVAHYGNTSCCDILNPQDWWTIPKVTIWQPFSDYLRKNGYQDQTTLRAAPYDFRLYGDPCFNVVYFQQLKDMVEKAYQPFHRRVALISHSMGGPILHQFLALQSMSWKAYYIERFIAIAAPFSGAPEGLREYITGSLVTGNWVPSVIGKPLAVAFRSWPATMSLLPMETSSSSSSSSSDDVVDGDDSSNNNNSQISHRNRAWDNITLVSTPSRNYTGTRGKKNVDNIGDLLEKIANTAGRGRPNNTNLGIVYWRQQEIMRLRVLNKGPGVTTNCLFLTAIPTPIGAVFGDDNMTKQTSILYGEGDGSVAAVSARASCQQWREHKEMMNDDYDVSVDSFALGPYVNHRSVLGAKEILEKVGLLLGL